MSTSERKYTFSDLILQTSHPIAYTTLTYNGSRSADDIYEFVLLDQPLVPEGNLVAECNGNQIYNTPNGRLRIYTALTAKDGCQVACLFCDDGHHTMYYPASKWDYYANPLHCAHLICGELLLLRHQAFLLHSAVVEITGQTVLFSGPSGVGKSTQAEIWEKRFHADILNGDRCVVMQKEDGFYGGGSLWAGSSGIYRPEQAPIKAICLLSQAEENRIERVHGTGAFIPLWEQTVLNPWDTAFMERMTALYDALLGSVPVYRFYNCADTAGADLAYNTIFGEDKP